MYSFSLDNKLLKQDVLVAWLYLIFTFILLGDKTRASHILWKCSATKLYPQLLVVNFLKA
jgi:hypothetical protein